MRERVGWRVGPGALLVPVLVALLATLWILERRSRTGPPLTPPEAFRAELVEAWVGELELADRRVSARLVRLHADPERQAFDARSLARRLSLEAGEPFLLELVWSASSSADPTLDAAAELPLANLAVRDARGRALASLATPGARSPLAGARDPLTALLAPPAEPLRPGRAVEVFLWGRAPDERATLETGAGTSLSLFADRVPWSELPHWLARAAASDASAGSEREDAADTVVR